MNGCCFNPIRAEIIGIIETTPPEPPVESNWCVQWVSVPYSVFFPCGTDNEINGNTNSGEICGGNFFIGDFDGNADHTFYYDSSGPDNTWYAQVIRPSADPALETLGTHSYDVFGNPSGPIPIVPSDQNCVLRTFQAVFTVPDVSTNQFSRIIFDAFQIDLVANFWPFDTPNVGDLYLADISTSRIGPEATVDVQLNGNEVTLTIVSLIEITTGAYGTEVGPETQFPFVEI